MINNFKKYKQLSGQFDGRRSIRLKGYDYSQVGMYFITICAKDRHNLFGEIKNEEMILNELGKYVNEFWCRITEHFVNIDLDEYIVMPNHLHGIIFINDCWGAVSAPIITVSDISLSSKGGETPPLQPTLGQIIGYYKYQSTKQLNEMNKTVGKSVWQRNYYEHIIRNEQSLDKIRNYICNNPGNWQTDIENPQTYQKFNNQQIRNYYKNLF